jgi:hypothetical protein
VLLIALAATACSGVIVPGEGYDGSSQPGDDLSETPSDDGDDQGGDDLEDLDDANLEQIDIEGPSVLPHVQRFANRACAAVASCQPSTYAGHSPVAAQALDNLVTPAYGQTSADDNQLGDTLAEYALAHKAENGIDYVIWLQRINFGDGNGWKAMENRGSITQNHYDHVHISFEQTAPE